MKTLLLSLLGCTLLRAQDARPSPAPAPAVTLRLFDVGPLEAPLARRLGGAPAQGRLPARIDELLRLYAREPLGRDALSLDGPGRTLIARVDAARGEWLSRFLARQSEGETRALLIEASVFRVSEPDAAALGISDDARMFGDSVEATTLVQRLGELAGTQQERLPPLETIPLAIARTARTTPLPYVREWRVYEKAEPGGRQVLDPVVEVIEEGAVLDTRAVLLEDGEVGVELELTWRRVERPIEVAQRDVAGQVREVALPRVAETRVSSALVVPVGSTAVLALPEGGKQVSVVVFRIGIPAPTTRKR